MESPQHVSSNRAAEHHYSQDDIERVLAHERGHVVVQTSGSTGEPKGVLIDSAALRASADATHHLLDGPGQWLLTLDTHHIAGIAVLSRSVIAGTQAITLPEGPSFTPERFSRATIQLTDSNTYTSLVPTQLHRLLHEIETGGPQAQATKPALQSYNAILVGGAATSQNDLDYARSLDIAVVTTYGMSETSGGCVYNNRPFDNVAIKLDHTNRIHIASAVLAQGYLASVDLAHRPDCVEPHPLRESDAFLTDSHGVRWHRTNDLGVIDPHSQELTIVGRADDVILSGGLNIAPALIENALGGRFSISQICVVGVPDPEWGQKVVALYTSAAAASGPEVSGPVSRISAASTNSTASPTSGSGELPVQEIKAYVIATLGAGYMPREFIKVAQLPHTTSGKIDRRTATKLATARTLKS